MSIGQINFFLVTLPCHFVLPEMFGVLSMTDIDYRRTSLEGDHSVDPQGSSPLPPLSLTCPHSLSYYHAADTLLYVWFTISNMATWIDGWSPRDGGRLLTRSCILVRQGQKNRWRIRTRRNQAVVTTRYRLLKGVVAFASLCMVIVSSFRLRIVWPVALICVLDLVVVFWAASCEFTLCKLLIGLVQINRRRHTCSHISQGLDTAPQA